MEKFTTSQLQAALLGLYKRNDRDAFNAYQMTFDELSSRMGDEALDAWCEANGI